MYAIFRSRRVRTVKRLADPVPANGAEVPGGWWPPLMLDPSWINQNHAVESCQPIANDRLDVEFVLLTAEVDPASRLAGALGPLWDRT
jgi:hypothetical protein